MVNYTHIPGKGATAVLTSDDLIQAGLEGEPLELDRVVEVVSLTKDAGELLDELTPHQREKHTGQWDQ